MSNRKLGFVVGRFQPFHYGHKHLIETAYENCDELVVFIGSAQESRTEKNPFTFQERWRMIYDDVCVNGSRNIIFIPLNDCETNQEWLDSICDELNFMNKWTSDIVETVFFCCDKDETTTESNNLFQDINLTIERVDNPHGLNATDIRKMLFTGMEFQIIDFVPHSTLRVIDSSKIIDEIGSKYQYTEN